MITRDGSNPAVEQFRISTRRDELDIPLIHRFLAQQSYWARGIPLDVVQRSIDHSLCFGGFVGTSQVAFARVISDYATFANLMDVFVIPEHRGKGYGKTIVSAVISHPDLQGLRRFALATADAHSLYARFGFTPLAKPHLFMERHVPDIYTVANKLSRDPDSESGDPSWRFQ